MSDRDWQWGWEERSSREREEAQGDGPQLAAPVTAARTPERPRPGPDRFRRRRAVAALALIVPVAIALALVAISGGGRRHRAPHLRALAVPLSRAEREALVDHAEERAIDSVLAYTPFVAQGGDRGDEVALTFDDGPGPYTARLVSVLNSLHAHATFFAVGAEERWFSAGTLDELRSGDVVGDHTESHPMLAQLSAHDQHEQLFEAQLRLELLGEPAPRLFRPPFASFDATTLRQLRRLHMLMVLWSTDTADYKLPGVRAIVHRALAGAHPGAIILMHDGGGDRSQTIAALPSIVRGLRRRGLRPVTVPRLLLDDPPPRDQPIPHTLRDG